jgi:hypothetical protein
LNVLTCVIKSYDRRHLVDTDVVSPMEGEGSDGAEEGDATLIGSDLLPQLDMLDVLPSAELAQSR